MEKFKLLPLTNIRSFWRICFRPRLGQRSEKRQFQLTMGRENAFCLVNILIQSLLYVSLFTLFLHFFFIDQLREFLRADTTFITSFEQRNNEKIPDMLICPDPGYKKTMKSEFNISDDINIGFKVALYNESMWELYQNFTFLIDKDFYLFFNYIKPPIQLHYGSRTTINNGSNYIEVWPIATIYHGFCTLVLTNIHQNSFPYKFDFAIALHQDITEKPKGFNIYFTDLKNWHEIVLNDWRYTNPSIQYLPIKENKQSLYFISLNRIHETNYMNGIMDREKCIEEMFDKKDCETKCFPLILNFLPNLEPCQSFEDMKCAINPEFNPMGSNIGNKMYQCLAPHSTTEYVSTVNEFNIDTPNKSQINFQYKFITPRVEVKNER